MTPIMISVNIKNVCDVVSYTENTDNECTALCFSVLFTIKRLASLGGSDHNQRYGRMVNNEDQEGRKGQAEDQNPGKGDCLFQGSRHRRRRDRRSHEARRPDYRRAVQPLRVKG